MTFYCQSVVFNKMFRNLRNRGGTNVVLIKTMCSDHDPGPYLKGQGHMRHLKVRVHMLVSALIITYLCIKASTGI